MILSLSACEKEIVLTDEHRTDRLTINAIVNPDTVVYAYVTEANEIDYFNLIYMRADYYHYNKISADKKYMYLVKEEVYYIYYFKERGQLIVFIVGN